MPALRRSDIHFEQCTSFLKDIEHYEGPKRGKKLSEERKFWNERPELIKAVVESDAPIKAIFAFAKANELPLPSMSTFGNWVKDWRKEAQTEAQAMEAIAPELINEQSNGYVPELATV